MPQEQNAWWSWTKRRGFKLITTKFTPLGVGLRGFLFSLRLLVVAVSLGLLTNLSATVSWFWKGLAYVGAAFIVVVAENGIQTLKARLEKHSERDSQERLKQILVPLNGAIEEMRDGRSVIDRALIALEQNVKAAISDEDDPVALCANLMSFDFRARELAIVRWGSRDTERFSRSIPLDEANPLPGAARAFVEQRMVYIPDTEDPELAQYFVDRPYKSVLSIPIRISPGRPVVIGIVNIDSTEKGYFRSDEFIRKELKMIVLPFVNLISLELQRNTVSVQTEAQNV